MEILSKINLIAARPLIGLVWIYQRTLSPDHGPLRIHFPHGYCKFYPTCSEYAKQVLQKRGLVGIPKIFIRVGKCNPFTLPAIDKA